jgi:hypothetical protein
MLADGGADGLACHLDLPVEATHIRHQLASNAFALDVGGGDGVDLAQQGGGPGGPELQGGPAGCQISKQHVQAAQDAGAFGDQLQPHPVGEARPR